MDRRRTGHFTDVLDSEDEQVITHRRLNGRDKSSGDERVIFTEEFRFRARTTARGTSHFRKGVSIATTALCMHKNPRIIHDPQIESMYYSIPQIPMKASQNPPRYLIMPTVVIDRVEHFSNRIESTSITFRDVLLTLLSLSLADLGRETGLDGSDGSSRTARVACDKVETVLTLAELRVWRTAGLAGNVLD